MRKYYYILCACLILACNKPKATIEPNAVAQEVHNNTIRILEPTLTNGRWVFESEQAFEDYIQYLDNTDLDAWETSKNFYSFRKNFLDGLSEEDRGNLTELPIDDDQLLTLVNTDGMIEVSPWIFKFNTVTKKIYALHTNFISDIDLLSSEAPQGTHIRTFDFEDDVFEALEDYPNGRINVTCALADVNGTGSNAKGTWDSPYCSNYKICLKLRC